MFWLGLGIGVIVGVVIGVVGLCLIAAYCDDSEDRNNWQ